MTSKLKQEKIKYSKIVKLVKKAEKEATKFIQKNMKVDPQLKIRYS